MYKIIKMSLESVYDPDYLLLQKSEKLLSEHVELGLNKLRSSSIVIEVRFIYTRTVYFRQAHFEICPFRARYSKSTVENCKSFGAVRIGYVRYNISKDLAKNLFLFSYTYVTKSQLITTFYKRFFSEPFILIIFACFA